MAQIPKNLRVNDLTQYLEAQKVELSHQGKVRNTNSLSPEQLLLVATDRISIFDFVLNAEIPKKGEILTALTHFWLTKLLYNFDHHLIGSKSHPTANLAYDLRNEKLPELPIERCLVVENMTGQVWPFEMIYRHHIGGSVFKTYQETGSAGGNWLPAGLAKWSKLDQPIFTPSTKEDVGHDINVDVDYFLTEMNKKGLGSQAFTTIAVLSKAYSLAYAYAKQKGILILDTKLEVAGNKIVDEIFTPDSSRFVLETDWEEAMSKGLEPDFYDKEVVRIWGKSIETPFRVTGINKLNPENPEHVAFVHSLKLPDEIIQETTRRYQEIFKKLTGDDLRKYQKERMGV
ncbi:MAG: phosphoribosylaminoimidazolesuccinocarboxamide synthase [Patescibacteria group bacterium]|jgi:phosphoribosylaminoimidazole-succinocarboxamide synthase